MEQNEPETPRSGAIDAGGPLKRKSMGGWKRRAEWIEGLCSKLTLSSRFLNPHGCGGTIAAMDRLLRCTN
jgi:hypothetical protein